MTTLNSAIKEYLSENEIHNLNAYYNSNSKDSDLSLEEKSKILLEFINQDFINIYFQKINGNPYNIFNNNMFHIGSGTQGIVFSLYLKNLDFLNDIVGYNIKFCNESIANIKIACKIQLISPKNKYFEARMLREETIMMKLNKFSTIKQSIPKFYGGFSIISNNNKFRITLMELIEPGRFENIQSILTRLSSEQSDQIIIHLKKLIHTLWKHGISHNDISIRNILVDSWDISNIKLIDFGLSTIFNHEFKNNSNLEEEYNLFFINKSKQEQLGSNVSKLNEIIQILKNKN